jgi:hypothetical protein
MKPERFVLDRFTVASTSYLIRGILDRFDCELITSQADFRRHYDEVDVLLSLEPKFAAPVLNWRGGIFGLGRRKPKPSYVLCSDAHLLKWRERYFLDNRISYMLTLYRAPFRYHFRKIPEERLVHFPWTVPDEWFHDAAVTCERQEVLCCFGASQGDAYNVRNWCKGFDFVKPFSFSGVENKQLRGKGYFNWLTSFDAIVAAGSDLPQYDLTTPKYFEIAAAGSLLFAQRTGDLETLGFRHGENCIAFDKGDFESRAREYLRSPEDYLGIREAGRRMVRKSHALSVRLDFLEQHIREHL